MQVTTCRTCRVQSECYTMYPVYVSCSLSSAIIPYMLFKYHICHLLPYSESRCTKGSAITGEAEKCPGVLLVSKAIRPGHSWQICQVFVPQSAIISFTD